MLARQLRIFHRLQLAAHLSHKHADRLTTHATGLTIAQVSVLTTIRELSAPTQRQVARELGVNESAVAEMITRLIALEMVTRSRAASDGRAWELNLTPSGRSTLAKASKAFAQLNAAIADSVSDAEIEQLAMHLEELVEKFNECLDT